jgi:hypothetical protein
LSENKNGQSEENSALFCSGTRAGFLSSSDIQPFEYFVDRFVDLKAKNWVNFARFYSGKSVFTKVMECREISWQILLSWQITAA